MRQLSFDPRIPRVRLAFGIQRIASLGPGVMKVPEWSCPAQAPSPKTLPPDWPQFKEMMEKTRTLEGYNLYFSGIDRLTPTGVRVVERVNTRENVVYLTFDDGPFARGDGTEASTIDLVNIIKAKGVTATFFLQGFWSWVHPEILRDIVGSGSNIGNHTYHHPPDGYEQGPIQGEKKKLAQHAPAGQSQEILWGRAGILWGLGLQKKGLTRLFRSPHGSGVIPSDRDPDLIARIARNGQIIINGNQRLSDAKPNLTREKLIQTYRDYFGNAPPGSRRGQILWLHSGLKATVEALPEILDLLRGYGYQVSALPEDPVPVA